MAYIALATAAPGIVGPMQTYPQVARILNDLADALLVNDQGISRHERELIAAYVSWGNRCHFCHRSHRAFAEAVALPDELNRIQSLFDANEPPDVAGLSPKLQALLALAEQVRADATQVTADHMEAARRHGADDHTLHDTVLIAALFGLFNRYVDGLGTYAPEPGAPYYSEAADRTTAVGYAASV